MGQKITDNCKRILAMKCQGIVPGHYIKSRKCISVNVLQDSSSYFPDWHTFTMLSAYFITIDTARPLQMRQFKQIVFEGQGVRNLGLSKS